MLKFSRIIKLLILSELQFCPKKFFESVGWLVVDETIKGNTV